MFFFRILHIIAAIFFGLSAYVQKNDPDAEIWIIIYLLPAFLSLSTAIWPGFTELAIISCMNTVIIVGYCLYGGFVLASNYDFDENLLHWIIHDEAGREFSGLMIVTLWSAAMHGSSRSIPKQTLLMTSLIVIAPAAYWLYIYFDHSFRLLWPEHCQTALYPDS
ncbi:transmembrane protein 220-like [Clavelina lepadiformis]|uniref:Transmembrane protein 220 n=1 Tax=Clavelina lepadiformis TaxID=159417 RepID=A0ABP0GUI8_CLALP